MGDVGYPETSNHLQGLALEASVRNERHSGDYIDVFPGERAQEDAMRRESDGLQCPVTVFRPGF